MRLEVPIFRQERDWSCLVACVRMCLTYVGIERSEDELVTLLGASPLGLTLEQASEGIRGLDCEVELAYNRDLLWLINRVLDEEAVIVATLIRFVDDCEVRHAVVVVGLGDHEIEVIDPAAGEIVRMPQQELYKRWRAVNGAALVIG